MPGNEGTVSDESTRKIFVAIVGAFLGIVWAGAMVEDGLAQIADRPATVGSSRIPVPSAEACRQSLAQVRDIFADEFRQAVTGAKKATLAKQLQDQAAATAEPSDRWVLLSEALRLSTEAGDVPTAADIIDLISREFAVEDSAFQLDSLAKLAAKAPPSAAAQISGKMLEIARRAISSNDDAAAAKAITSAAVLARKARNADLLAEAMQLQNAAKERQKESKQLAAVVEKLKKSPEDAEVCLEAGKHYCFRRDDWTAGLPLLARGADAELAALAKAELGARRNQSPLLPIADAWWDWSEDDVSQSKAAAMAHAADIYRGVVGTLAGLDRVRIDRRIAEAAAGSRSGRNSLARRIPGLLVWLDASAPNTVESEGASVPRGAVSVWRDMSGAGNDATQQEAARQPRLVQQTGQGRPLVVFDGSQTLAVDMPLGASGTVVAVVVPEKRANMRFLGCYLTTISDYTGMCLRDNGSIWGEAKLVSGPLAASYAPENSYTAKAPLLTAMTWGREVVVWKGATPVARSTPAAAAATSAGPWGLGGAYLPKVVEYFSGGIAEILVYDRELTGQEISSLSVELAAKWGVR
jgi:hypothetical protein